MSYLIQGLLLGLAYVAPIGMQNLYVINTAIEQSRLRALQVALITIFFDITLAFACFWGIGQIMERLEVLQLAVSGIGSLAVLWIGFSLMRSKGVVDSGQDYNKPLLQVIATCFVVTWLNPQAIIDGTLLLGGFRATLAETASAWFISGVVLASAIWFLSVSMLASTFRKAFNSKVMQVINVVCGGILMVFGVKLGIGFLEMLW